MEQDRSHIPVMLTEVLSALAPEDGGVYVDGTFGAGGYSRAFLDAADCTVIAIDRDPEAVRRAQALKEDYRDRLIVVHGRFGDALELVRAAGYRQVDGFVLDVGVSSMQLDEAGRGFSFLRAGPLDMRMDPEDEESPSAADLVNDLGEAALADLIYHYGNERLSRKIARRITAARAAGRIETTQELAELVRAAVPRSRKDGLDPATRTFQALRIAVNDEIGELCRALRAAEHLLRPGGRLAVVSFHSLEDGEVKGFLYERSGRKGGGVSRHLPQLSGGRGDAQMPVPSFSLQPARALKPAADEIQRNPRARSARLRIGVRTDAPAWADNFEKPSSPHGPGGAAGAAGPKPSSARSKPERGRWRK